jgi:hypothetical protein
MVFAVTLVGVCIYLGLLLVLISFMLNYFCSKSETTREILIVSAIEMTVIVV